MTKSFRVSLIGRYKAILRTSDKHPAPEDKKSSCSEDSELEKFGAWATVVIDRASRVRLTPTHDELKSSEESVAVKAAYPVLRVLNDGSVVRISDSGVGAVRNSKNNKSKEVFVEYNESDMNFQKLQTLYQIASYARKTGKTFDMTGAAALPLLAASLIADQFSTVQTYHYEIKPGISRLPEGLFAPTKVAQAIRRAEIEAGFNIDITSAIRTEGEQSKLFKALNGKQSVAPPGASYHDIRRGGIAIDVDNWQKAKPFLERHGFLHGEPGVGELWNDPWHFVYVYKG